MAVLVFGVARIFANLNFWGSLEKVLSGKFCILCYHTTGYRYAKFSSDSEVYKARSKRYGSVVALKKILMHNEKDGVSLLYSITIAIC